MTVNGTDPTTGDVECFWWDGKEMKRASFNPAALQRYVEQEVPVRTSNRRRGSAWSA